MPRDIVFSVWGISNNRWSSSFLIPCLFNKYFSFLLFLGYSVTYREVSPSLGDHSRVLWGQIMANGLPHKCQTTCLFSKPNLHGFKRPVTLYPKPSTSFDLFHWTKCSCILRPLYASSLSFCSKPFCLVLWAKNTPFDVKSGWFIIQSLCAHLFGTPSVNL